MNNAQVISKTVNLNILEILNRAPIRDEFHDREIVGNKNISTYISPEVP